MDKLHECRRTEISIPYTEITCSLTYHLLHKLLRQLPFRSKFFKKTLIGFMIGDRDHPAVHITVHHPAIIILFHRNNSLCYMCRISSRIDEQSAVLLPDYSSGMVMSHDYQIKAIHLAGHNIRCVLHPFPGGMSAMITGMEQPYDDIRTLPLPYMPHPSAGTLHHRLDIKPFPQLFRQPCRNSRCKKPEHSKTHTITLHNCIRLEIRLPGGYISDICTEKRDGRKVGTETVIDRMAGLYIMIPYCHRIISHTLHPRHRMSCPSLYKIIEIHGRLPLQYIAIVKKQHTILPHYSALRLNISRHPRQ